MFEVRLRFGASSHHVEHLSSGSRRVRPDGRGVDLGGEIEVGFGERFGQSRILPAGFTNFQGKGFDKGSE